MDLIDLDKVPKVESDTTPPAKRAFVQRGGTIIRFGDLPQEERDRVIGDVAIMMTNFPFTAPLKVTPKELTEAVMSGEPQEVAAMGPYYIRRITIRYAPSPLGDQDSMIREVWLSPGSLCPVVDFGRASMARHVDRPLPNILTCAKGNHVKMVELWFEL